MKTLSLTGLVPVSMARRLVLAAALSLSFWAHPAAGGSAAEVATKLDELKDKVATEATSILKTNRVTGSYTTVWREFEDAAIVALKTVLPRHIPSLTETNFDTGHAGREKNRLADLAIVCGTNVIEISIKAARGDSKSGKRHGHVPGSSQAATHVHRRVHLVGAL